MVSICFLSERCGFDDAAEGTVRRVHASTAQIRTRNLLGCRIYNADFSTGVVPELYSPTSPQGGLKPCRVVVGYLRIDLCVPSSHGTSESVRLNSASGR